MNKNKYLPNIDQYLESIDNNIPVTLQGLDDIIDKVASQVPLTSEQTKIIVRLFFQEIRHALLRNQKIALRKLGSFFISSPKFGNKVKVFAKFKPSKFLIKELNGR